MANLADMREQYQHTTLLEEHLQTNPLLQFQGWLDAAIASDLPEPNALTLATVDAQGQPSTRVVLLKGIDDGLIFYSNYQSRKAQDILANPRVAANFLWLELERQVRIEGTVSKISRSASEAYFQSRPRGSQLGALVSPQSQSIPNRAYLDDALAELEARYPDTPNTVSVPEPIPLPEHWGGYHIKPHRWEFWQGRRNRLHDRFCYYQENTDTDIWHIQRLAP